MTKREFIKRAKARGAVIHKGNPKTAKPLPEVTGNLTLKRIKEIPNEWYR